MTRSGTSADPLTGLAHRTLLGPRLQRLCTVCLEPMVDRDDDLPVASGVS